MGLEQGDTPSCSVDSNDDRILERLEWRDVSPARIFSRGLQSAENIKDIKESKKAFDNGQLNLGELLNEIENL